MDLGACDTSLQLHDNQDLPVLSRLLLFVAHPNVDTSVAKPPADAKDQKSCKSRPAVVYVSPQSGVLACWFQLDPRLFPFIFILVVVLSHKSSSNLVYSMPKYQA